MIRSETLKIAILQMTSIDNLESNFNFITKHLEVMQSEQVDLICLPENALYMRMKEGENVPQFALSHEVFSKLAQFSQKLKCSIHIGSVPIIENEKCFNSSVLIEPTGVISSSYKKMHLFDIQLDGQKPIKESDVFSHGDAPQIIEINGWKIGQSICYDLRFSELFNYYARHQVDLVLVPSAFLVKTGEAHWHILLRARAIESQVFVVAAAQGGAHLGEKGQRDTFGHSLVIDPWGRILSDSELSSGLSFVEINSSELKKIHAQIPMANHRRPVVLFENK